MNAKTLISPRSFLTFTVVLSIVLLTSCSKSCNRQQGTEEKPVVAGPSDTKTVTKIDPPVIEEEKDKDDSVDKQQPTLIAQIRSSVRQVLSTVFRIRGGSRPLIADRTYPLRSGDRIKTNDSGTAEVNIAGCMTIYVFASSGLALSTCPGFARGSAVCSTNGTSLFNNTCQSRIRKVETDTAEIRLEGTWFRVAHWPEKKRTIIDVHEGPVQVRQVIKEGVRRWLSEPVEIKEGCWCAPSDQCFQPGVPSNGPQPCTKLTAENAAYLDRTKDQAGARALLDDKPIAPGPSLDGLSVTSDPAAPTLQDTIHFGPIDAGSDAVKRLTITNNSSLPLKFSGVSLINSTAPFSTENNTCALGTVEMGKSCGLDVRFKPAVPGTYQNTLEITDNAKGSPRRVLLRGSGVPVWGVTTLVSPASLQFAQQPLNEPSKSQRVTISKTRMIGEPIIEGPAKDEYKVISNTCTTDDRLECELDVVFTPKVAGERIATLVISPPVGLPGFLPAKKTVPLRGVGASDASGPTSTTLSPVVKLPIDEVCFNAHKVVDSKAVRVRKDQSITVTNSGTGPLVIRSITPSTKDFMVTSQNCIGRNVNDKCEITVGFTPTDTGVRSGVLTINSNDPKKPATAVRLAGRGKHRNWFIRGVHWLFRVNQGDKCEF
ncbi:MAG TPA: choice-of-anchor D domain-containing protein [Pyrinomonadaceae bacterium]|nr:choice-of-anchor D domain-containing protein [Pyrinomonadaceae bacterium]